MKMENEKMERLTKGKFKKSKHNRSNSCNSIKLTSTSKKKSANSIFAPYIKKIIKSKN
jgi:hypothetical protein